ncbi:MAG: hypothetical protein Q8L02_02150 [Candidatus Nitrotoga sp.]|nr:hypothetical protein [Candidatus Nitrotoga sp.]
MDQVRAQSVDNPVTLKDDLANIFQPGLGHLPADSRVDDQLLCGSRHGVDKTGRVEVWPWIVNNGHQQIHAANLFS